MSTVVHRPDLTFVLRDWLDLETLLSRDRYAMHSYDTVEAMLDATDQIARDLVAPSLRSGDVNEPWLDGDRRVHVDDLVRRAVRGIADGGLFGVVFDEKRGGLQLPFLVYVAAMGILHAANSAAAFYMMLTVGNARLIAEGGSDALFDGFGAPQVEGATLGTMCLSESQAGSSLGDITTHAVLESSDSFGERYRITGNKMWISGGDHDVTANIVHLVLAKVSDDSGAVAAGSRGISLFVVPKILPDGQVNDIVSSGLNHKMGARGLPNCALNLGEGYKQPDGRAGAVGWLVGAEGQGLPLMFQMMNEARISVGVASAMTAYRGYLLSLDYARERRQGRKAGVPTGPQVPIIEHVDVRRMLLAQKAISEGAIALTFFTARQQDDESSAPDAETRACATSLLGLLTPIAKSWPAEFGQRSLHEAIQVLGGAGYTRDFALEQLYRDNRLNPIHEGTTGVQGLDLVNRKLRRDGGAGYRVLRDGVTRTIDAAHRIDELGRDAYVIAGAWATVDKAVERLLASEDGRADDHATAFLHAMGHAVVGWLWLDMATVASEKLSVDGEGDRNFRQGKLQACHYFADVELPLVHAWLDPLVRGSDAARAITAEQFLGEAK